MALVFINTANRKKMKLIFIKKKKAANIKQRVPAARNEVKTAIILSLFWEFYIKLLHNNQILKYDHKFCLDFRNVAAVLGPIYRKIMSSNGIY